MISSFLRGLSLGLAVSASRQMPASFTDLASQAASLANEVEQQLFHN
jgi:hypothetical protein